ncbi:hypothetical protein AB6A23_09915 [Paenibacillus tarimensis]
MDRLIIFLLDNIFYVVIAIGFLLSLFRSARKANRMPDFGGGGDGEKRSVVPAGQHPGQEREGRYSNRPEASIPANTAAQDSTVRYPIRYDLMNSSEKRVDSAESAAHERRRREASERKQRQVIPSDRSGGGLAQPGVQEASAEEMRRAVMWAEILGPPRAKRPFR